MPQFLIPARHKVGDRVSLSEDEAHHLSLVLRKKTGDEIRLTDGDGGRFVGMLEEVTKKTAVAVLRESLPAVKKNGRVLFAQGLLKGDKMEFVLQKAAELGVDTLLPFSSSRTVVEWKKGSDKLKRWRKIAESAAKQCGRATHMTVEEPAMFEKIISAVDAEMKILFWEEASDPLRSAFENGVSAKTTAVLVGPEGGLSEDEVDLAVRHGFTPRSLGPLILRAETAAVTAISLIQYELGNI